MVRNQKILKEGQISKKDPQRLFKERESSSTSVQESAQLIEQWHEEIQSLKNQRFSSIEEAVSVIANNVVKKLELNDSRAEETRHFVENILLTDPIISDQLHKLLKIDA